MKFVLGEYLPEFVPIDVANSNGRTIASWIAIWGDVVCGPYTDIYKDFIWHWRCEEASQCQKGKKAVDPQYDNIEGGHREALVECTFGGGQQ
jgi:hypothetical protein